LRPGVNRIIRGYGMDTFFWYAILGRKGFQIAVGIFILTVFSVWLYATITSLFKKPDNLTKKYNTLGLFTVVLFSIIGVLFFLLGTIITLFNIAVKENTLLFIGIPLVIIGFFFIVCLIRNGYNSKKNKAADFEQPILMAEKD
jgi:hypothetical protein